MSGQGVTKVGQQELYDQVWSAPVSKIAVEYGVSDVALAKTCRKLGIPLPGRGYWNKVQNGKRVRPRPALPATKGAETVAITRSPPVCPVNGSHPAFAACLDVIAAGKAVIDTKDALPLHPAVWPKAARKAAVRGGEGAEPRTMPVSVTKEHDDRARRLLDALARGLEASGYEVSADGVQIEGCCVPIAISEQQDRVAHEPTARELARKEKYPWERIPTWDHKPSGRLSIYSDVDLWPRQDVRKRWSDTRHQKLEDKLNDILLGLVAVAIATKLKDEEARARQEARAEAHRQHLERERQVREAAARAKHVREQATCLAEASSIRLLIDTVRARLQTTPAASGAELQAWLATAERVASELDPLADGLVAMLKNHEAIASAARQPLTRYGYALLP